MDSGKLIIWVILMPGPSKILQDLRWARQRIMKKSRDKSGNTIGRKMKTLQIERRSFTATAPH
jgi:hypothetical protein